MHEIAGAEKYKGIEGWNRPFTLFGRQLTEPKHRLNKVEYQGRLRRNL